MISLSSSAYPVGCESFDSSVGSMYDTKHHDLERYLRMMVIYVCTNQILKACLRNLKFEKVRNHVRLFGLAKLGCQSIEVLACINGESWDAGVKADHIEGR